MKIEKINDNQIRCTLTKDDLADRQIKLSELAYGTDKAKDLFRDMMQQAAFEFGFEAEDIPLMIEAIPVSSENIILIITKVENPEELDTRFSQFSPAGEEDFPSSEIDVSPLLEAADDILDLFGKLAPGKSDKQPPKDKSDFVPLAETLGHKGTATSEPETKMPVAQVITDITKLYSFPDLASVSRVASVVSSFYDGDNSLFKNPSNNAYYLFLSKGEHSPEDFNKLCNIFSEYAHQEKFSNSVQAFFEEHCETIIRGNALQVMGSI